MGTAGCDLAPNRISQGAARVQVHCRSGEPRGGLYLDGEISGGWDLLHALVGLHAGHFAADHRAAALPAARLEHLHGVLIRHLQQHLLILLLLHPAPQPQHGLEGDPGQSSE